MTEARGYLQEASREGAADLVACAPVTSSSLPPARSLRVHLAFGPSSTPWDGGRERKPFAGRKWHGNEPEVSDHQLLVQLTGPAGRIFCWRQRETSRGGRKTESGRKRGRKT